MIRFNPIFEEILDKTTKIWRYMDFTKFTSLLSTSSLYFARADSLGDPFEGSWTNFDLEEFKDYINKIVKSGLVSQKAADLLHEHMISAPKNVAISCWHVNNYESAAMWELYLKGNPGIAIQTTLESFENSFEDTKEEISFGRVHYKDYDHEKFEGDIFTASICRPFAHKRINFIHESEFRAFYMRPNDDHRNNDTGISERGKFFKVKLPTLIHKIYICSNAPGGFKSLLEDHIRKYGYEMQPIQSKLDNNPVF